jgi:hypothetical protein
MDSLGRLPVDRAARVKSSCSRPLHAALACTRQLFELLPPDVSLHGHIVVTFFISDEIPNASVVLGSMSAEFGLY